MIRKIKGHPDYLINSKGEVYSLKNNSKGKRLKSHYDKNEYERIGLCENGKQKQYFVHRLLAETFIPNPNNKPFINHKDENKQNNSIKNLEWCTSKENNSYGTRLKRIAISHKKRIAQMLDDYTVVKIWDSQTDASKSLSLNIKNINQCLKGKRLRCGGYKWRYIYGS